MASRIKKGPRKDHVEAARIPGETLDEATLRLQRARADTEELDRQKRQLDLDVANGKLISKNEATDLAQAAVLRVCQILDLIPERLRDRLPPSLYHICAELDDVIRQARTEIAAGG